MNFYASTKLNSPNKSLFLGKFEIMKLVFTLLFVACSSLIGYAQGEFGEICNWDGNKSAAVALTFDDWLTTHPTIVVPALQERNMIATFYYITQNMSTKQAEQLRIAASLGNEIGNHSHTHPQADTAIAKEARKSKHILDSVLEQQTLTFDYPYGTVSDLLYDSVRNAGHIAGRGVWPPSNYRYNFATTDNDYYNLRTVGVGGSGVTTLASYASYLTKVIKGGGFITYLYHGVGKSGDYANISTTMFNAQLDTVLSLKDKIWITTVANAVKYHKEANCATMSLVEKDETSLTISLSDTLVDSIYNQSLTLKVYNEGNLFSSATQNGNDIEIIYQNEEYALIRAIPDGGNIVLTYGEWKNVNIENEVLNVFTGSTTSMNVSITNLVGNLVWSSSNGEVATVDALGNVLANTVGKTVISCNLDGYKDSCCVIVKQAPEKTAIVPVTNAIVSVVGNTIIIHANANARVELHSQSGQLLACEKGTCSFPVQNAGIYIVTIDNKSQKILVE